MPIIRITKSAVDAIEFAASGQVIYKDAQLKGFGVKVGTGTKTYIAEGSPNGRTRLVTIGRHGVITTEQARKKAQAILQDMREGVDPNKVKKQARAKQLTLREAAELYLNAPKVRAPTTLAEYKATLSRYFKDWLDRPLSEITRKDCYDRHRKIGREHGTYAANGAMRAIRATYNRALKQFEDLPPVNPVIAVDWYPEEVRDAAIAAEDLAEWYQGIHRLPNPIRTDYYLFVLLSGLRRRSAAANHALSNDITGNYITAGESLRRSQQRVTDYLKQWMGVRAPAPKAAMEGRGGNATWSPADIWAGAAE